MLKIIKYAVFVLYVQSSLACAKGDASGKYVEAFQTSLDISVQILAGSINISPSYPSKSNS